MPKALASDGHNEKLIVFHKFSHLITAKTLILRVTDGVNGKFYSRGCISRHLASWRGHRSMANWLAFCRLAWGANQMLWVLFLTTLMSRMRQRKYGQVPESNWKTINQTPFVHFFRCELRITHKMSAVCVYAGKLVLWYCATVQLVLPEPFLFFRCVLVVELSLTCCCLGNLFYFF